MKTSWNRANAFITAAQQYIAKHPEQTKFKYALDRVVPRAQALQEQVQVRIAGIDIDNCMTDTRGVITKDPQGNLEFTKEGAKLRNEQHAQLLNLEEFEVEPYYARDVPEDLTLGELLVFMGFVVDAATVETRATLAQQESEATETAEAVN